MSDFVRSATKRKLEMNNLLIINKTKLNQIPF